MTTHHVIKAALKRSTAKRSFGRRVKHRAHHRRAKVDAAQPESASRRYQAFARDTMGRGQPGQRLADRTGSSAPAGDSPRSRDAAAPTRVADTAWDNVDVDGCGALSPWSDAEFAIRRRAGEEASFGVDDHEMHPGHDAYRRTGDDHPGHTEATD